MTFSGELFLALLCWFGPLKALLVLGCGGLYSFPVSVAVQSFWRCPPLHFQHGPFFFVLVAVAFLFSFKLAAYEIGWRSAWSRTIISDGLDFATCTNSGFTSSSFTCRFVTPELVFGLIWKYSFPACTASVRLCGFIFNRRFCK